VADTLLLAGSNDMGRTTWYLESFSIADITAPAAVSVREGTGAIYSVRVHEGLVFTGFSGTVNALPGIDAVVQQAFHRTGQFIIKPGRPAPSPAGSGFGQGGVGVFNLWNLGLMAFLMGLNPFDLGFFFFAGMAMLLLMAICGYFDPRELYTSGSLGMVFLVLLLASGGSDVAERSVPAPETCRLEQNYPNPFNPQTTIPYTVAEAAHVRLQVFDAQGRLVRTVLDERMPAGAHQAAFTADGLPSGMYFCRIEIGNRVERMRMVLLK
ncbi:T9SS type A sorting domain-containing protein, partial [bacterium]|nr:T9SS type A sorting domain-containing protein [bacterium]